MIQLHRALISVSDKTDLIPLAKLLHDLGVELLSTGGTASHLRDHNLPVTDVSEYTVFLKSLMEGKTLHPKIHRLLAIEKKHRTSPS